MVVVWWVLPGWWGKDDSLQPLLEFGQVLEREDDGVNIRREYCIRSSGVENMKYDVRRSKQSPSEIRCHP